MGAMVPSAVLEKRWWRRQWGGVQPDKCAFGWVSRVTLIPVHYLDSFSASSTAERMPSFFSSSTRSPFWCICRKMSQPPTNSPLKYTWGIVGQLEKSLTPVEGRQRQYYQSCFSEHLVGFKIRRSSLVTCLISIFKENLRGGVFFLPTETVAKAQTSTLTAKGLQPNSDLFI